MTIEIEIKNKRYIVPDEVAKHIAKLESKNAVDNWACGTTDCICNVKRKCDCHNYTKP